MKSPSALLTVFVSRPAWVYTPAVRAAVDTFYFSALASVRPTTSSTRTLRCPQMFGRLRLLLRDSLCNIHRQMPSRLLGAPCRTEHRSESWAIPSLCRATPSATSEHLVELLGSSPIPRSFVASGVSLQLRPLPSTGVTRLRRYYEPLRHPKRPGLSLASCPLIPTATTAGASRVATDPLCLHAVATTPAGPMDNLFARTFPSSSAFPESQAGRPLHRPFRGLLSVHSRYGLQTCQVAYATFCTGGFSSFVASPAAPIATGWSEPVPGRDFHPLWISAFSRRTEKRRLGVCPTENGSNGNLRGKFLERAMSTRFRPYYPEQRYLLPPSPSDWLAEGHLAYFIAEIVDTLEVDGFYAPYEGDGRRNSPYDPRMLLKVLVYAYASGVFSSRKIARKLEEDVAF